MINSTFPAKAGVPDPTDSFIPDFAQARWIAGNISDAAPTLRREFYLEKPLENASLSFAAPGYALFTINGRAVSDSVLDPVQTDYDVYSFFRTHKITSLLYPGKNVISCVLGNGWFAQNRVWEVGAYGEPALVAILRLQHEDDTIDTICTDSSWEVSTSGPLLENSVYGGNVYDARRETIKIWQSASEVSPLTPELRPQLLPPSRRIEEVKPVSITKPLPSTWTVDFGQNFSGWCRLRVTAPAGTEICLRFAEVLDPDGTIDPLTTGVWHTRTIQTDRYICRGGDEEVWEPQFTYHSFRYVEMTGFPGEPTSDVLTGIVVHTDLSVAGSFECSDPLLNRIHETARWTQRTNLHGLPTDCPGRERCGWLGDAHVCAPFVMLNWGSTGFWDKYVEDIVNSLGRGEANGHPDVPANIAPGRRRCGQANPDWAVALILIPYYIHLYTGDTRTVERHFDPMVRLLRYLDGIADDGIIRAGFGDWCPPGRVEPVATPVALTSTALYYRATTCLARLARSLGRPVEAAELERRAGMVRGRFIAEFQTADGAFGSQTADTLVLTFGLCPTGMESTVAARLAERVRANGSRFDTGIHGLRHFFDVLATYGYEDVCWEVLQSDGQPSFRHHFAQGGTTFWETFFDLTMHPEMIERSRNHPMQGAFAAWFTEGIAGIRPDPDCPGFRHLLMRPHLVKQLDWARCSHESPYGLIRSEWTRKNEALKWEIELPPGVSAEVSVPGMLEASMRQNSKKSDDPSESAPRISLQGGCHSLRFVAL